MKGNLKSISGFFLLLFLICGFTIIGNDFKQNQNIAKAQDTTTEIEASCSDLDSGLDYFTKGKVYGIDSEGNSFKIYDECSDDVLMEYICEGDSWVKKEYKCDNGCNDGKCIEVEESSTDDRERINPYDADVDTCRSSTGETYPTTGEGYANWFMWNGAPSVKYYEVIPNEEIELEVKTDSCSSCVCHYPDFDIYELSSGSWKLTKEYDLPNESGYKKTITYTPSSSKIKIKSSNYCFYLDIYKSSLDSDTEEEVVEEETEYTCGDGTCEDGESPLNCSEDCDKEDYEIIKASQGECTTWHADNVLNYYPCGNTKIYSVNEGDKIKISAYGDGCDSCVCYHVQFSLYEYDKENYSWKLIKTVNKPDEKSLRAVFDYTAESGKFKIVGNNKCFHLNVYKEINEDNGNEEESSDDEDVNLPDGTLIKLPGSPKVYVIRNRRKIWIQTAEEFNSSGYKWEDIQTIGEDEDEVSGVEIIKDTNGRVYRIINGKMIWVPTVAAFNAQGLKWEEVKEQVKTQLQYTETRLVKDSEGNIYYITNSGKKKLIINDEVFESYGNKIEDVVEVSDDILDSMEDITVIKSTNNPKVYIISGETKRWVKNIQAFNRLGLKWEDIDTVNETEIEAYTEGDSVE